MSFRPRSAARVASLALVSILGVSACTSNPSHRRVVLDQIDALELPADQQACMNEIVGTYQNGELEDIAEDETNDALNWNDENALAAASPELQQFVERLRGCVTGEGESTDTTEGSGTTDASETTEPVDTTEVSETTEAAGATEAADTTEAVETTEA